ncbi:MAG: hypothetical protein E5V63_03895 [Mesorhizobium sp.]|nr:MAG: hypothetical protein E5V63_03895 [Mesorhizobium sp.]
MGRYRDFSRMESQRDVHAQLNAMADQITGLKHIVIGLLTAVGHMDNAGKIDIAKVHDHLGKFIRDPKHPALSDGDLPQAMWSAQLVRDLGLQAAKDV